MNEEQQGRAAGQACEPRRRRAGIAAFLTGVVLTLAFFAFFPGLPHVIDWGAVIASLVVGGAVRWGCQAWIDRAERNASGPQG